MSANNANLDKVKNMSSDESNPGVNSDTSEKGGVEFDSANIKKQDQAKMFTKVAGAEKRAREAAREEAAEKRADERLKVAEAAAQRREEKEAKLVAAAKKDAERASKHKVRRRIIKIIATMACLLIIAIIGNSIIYRNSDEYSDKKYNEAIEHYWAYSIQMGQRIESGEDRESVIADYDSIVHSDEGESRLAGELAIVEFKYMYGSTNFGLSSRLKKANIYAKTENQKRWANEKMCTLLLINDYEQWQAECEERYE